MLWRYSGASLSLPWREPVDHLALGASLTIF
jgi:hypothetical protein